MKSAILTLPMLAIALLAMTASADLPAMPDTGVYHVSVGTQPLGIESFSFYVGKDSLFLSSRAEQTFPTQAGTDTLDKFVQMILGRLDQDLQWYQSDQRFRGRKLVRGLVLEDTSFTAYRETESGGTGNVLVRPPGKIYVVDVQSFMVFDFLCRNFHGKNFKSRRINMLVLSERDTVVEARVHNLGPETITWGKRSLEARKLKVSDGTTEFLAWVAPEGFMVRLQQEASGLRVERAPPGGFSSRQKP